MSKEKLNKGHWHEAADRAHCIIAMMEELLIEHPAINQTPDLKIKVEKAQALLGDVYQKAGAKMFS